MAFVRHRTSQAVHSWSELTAPGAAASPSCGAAGTGPTRPRRGGTAKPTLRATLIYWQACGRVPPTEFTANLKASGCSPELKAAEMASISASWRPHHQAMRAMSQPVRTHPSTSPWKPRSSGRPDHFVWRRASSDALRSGDDLIDQQPVLAALPVWLSGLVLDRVRLAGIVGRHDQTTQEARMHGL